MQYKILKKQNNTDTCFVCGMLNDAGLKAFFYDTIDEQGENALITKVNPQPFHQSYPNRMHGGIISALLDESMGRAVQITHPDIWAVTIDLNVKFRKPTPLDQTLYIESRVTDFGSRAFSAEGKMMLADGTVLATGSGKFFRVPYEQVFQDIKLDDTNWYVVDEDMPKFIEIGS